MIGLESHMDYVWFIIAILFLFAELQTPGLFFFISFAAGAFCSAMLAFAGYSLVTQCLGGLVVVMISFFLMRKYLKHKKHSEVHYGTPKSNVDALIGQEGIATEEIKPHQKGRVKIGGEEWLAQGKSGASIEKGTVVVVLRVVGITVIVKTKE